MSRRRSRTRTAPKEDRSVSGVVTWDQIAGESQSFISREKALTISAVYKAINLIATSVGKLPLNVFKRTKDGKEKAHWHPANSLLRYRFNSEMGAKVCKQTLTAHVLLHGDGYGYILRDPSGNPVEILPLNPTNTFPVRENGKLWYVTAINQEQRRIEATNILHLGGLSWDGLTGLSVLQYAARSFGVAMNASKHAASFFKNSARPGVVLEYPNKLKPEAAKALRENWDKMFKGIDNGHRTAVLEDGMTLKAFSLSAKDAQLIEAMRFSVVDIANWFGVPPHKLGDNSKSSYNSLEQENQSFLDDTLDNWLVTWEEECREKLLTEEQKRSDSYLIEFNRMALVRADLKTRADYYSRATGGAAWMSVNEVRSRENMNAAKSTDHDYNEVIQPTNNFDPNKSGSGDTNAPADDAPAQGDGEGDGNGNGKSGTDESED